MSESKSNLDDEDIVFVMYLFKKID